MTEKKTIKLDIANELFDSLRADLKDTQPEVLNSDEGAVEASRIERNLDILMSIKSAFSETGAAVIKGHESDPSSTDDPAEWGHLKIIERIGEGGFGVVYRAFDPLLERDVALKVKRQDQQDTLRNSQYIAEARRLARVNHPNVLAIHGAGINDHMVGMWADLIEGDTLTDLLKSEGVFSRDQIMDLLEQLSSALQTIHANGLVHGDIKSDNVMMSEGHAILMDFGAAEHHGERPRYGTPANMAPELFQEQPMSRRTDLYSLGALMYHMATGRYPRCHDNGEVVRSMADVRADLNPLLGKPVAALITSLLSPDPASRPDSSAITEQLQQIRDLPRRRKRRAVVFTVFASLVAGLSSSLIALKHVTEEGRKLEIVKDLVVESVQRVSPERQTGPASIKSLYESMAELSEKRLQSYPTALADMRMVIGQGLARYGDKERGLTLSESGLDLMLEYDLGTNRDRATYYNIIASLRKDANDLEGAELAIRKSIDYYTAIHEADYERENEAQIGEIRGRTLLANLLGRRGLLKEKLEAHQQILEDRIALYDGITANSAVDFYNLGHSLYSVDRSQEALQAHQQAMTLLEKDGQAETYKASLIRRGMADTLRKLGRYAESIEQLEHTRRLLQNHLPEGHGSFLDWEEVMAYTRYRAGDLSTAVQIYDALFQNPDYLKRLKQPVRDRYAQVLMDASRYQEASVQYGLIVDDMEPQITLKHAWYLAGQRYSAFQSLQPEQRTKTIEQTRASLQDYQSELRATGYPMVRENQLLDNWLSNLDSQASDTKLTAEPG